MSIYTLGSFAFFIMMVGIPLLIAVAGEFYEKRLRKF